MPLYSALVEFTLRTCDEGIGSLNGSSLQLLREWNLRGQSDERKIHRTVVSSSIISIYKFYKAKLLHENPKYVNYALLNPAHGFPGSDNN
jgi:hypothetical protein